MTDKDAILAEVIEYTSPPTQAEDEFTIVEYRSRCPLPRPNKDTARGRLNALVEAGLLESRKVLSNSKWALVYRKVDGKWKE